MIDGKNVVGVGEQDALGGRNVVGLVTIGMPGQKICSRTWEKLFPNGGKN